MKGIEQWKKLDDGAVRIVAFGSSNTELTWANEGSRYPDDYAKLMRDWIHVNHLSNFLIAQNICDRFGLPPLPISEDHTTDVNMLLARMDECSPRLQP